MAKKIPLRKCIATHELLPKMELLRIVRTPEGQVVADETGKLNGRGAYLKRSTEALEIAQKKDLLRKSLGVEIDEELYEEIRHIITQ